MNRATKIKLQDTILYAIHDAAIDVFEKSGVHIKKMPEYFINVIIANVLSNKFPSLGYRLEMPVKEVLKQSGIEKTLSPDDIRENGKFDIAITSRGSKKLRHIIEVKRSLSKRQLLKESIRLKALATESHKSKRLETGYIVALSIMKESVRSYDCESRIDSRLEYLNKKLGDAVTISCRYDVIKSDGYGLSDGESLLIAVFCIKKTS